MNTLIVATFSDIDEAETVYRELIRAGGGETLAPEEAVVAVVDETRDVHFRHTTHLTAPAALSGGFVGTLAGLIILNPALALIGGITGTALGTVLGAVKEAGIDEPFMQSLAQELKPRSSALFVRPLEGREADMADYLAKRAQKVLKSPLRHADEKRLKTALRQLEDNAEPS